MDIARLAKVLAIIVSVVGAIEFFSKYDQVITILIAVIGFVVGLTESKESRQNFFNGHTCFTSRKSSSTIITRFSNIYWSLCNRNNEKY